jgi:hypothetical protein
MSKKQKYTTTKTTKPQSQACWDRLYGSFGSIPSDHTPEQQKYKKEDKSSHPTSNDTTSNNRNERNISKPTFPSKCHQICKHCSEKWGGGPNSLIKRYWKISKRYISSHNRGTKNDPKSRDLQKL